MLAGEVALVIYRASQEYQRVRKGVRCTTLVMLPSVTSSSVNRVLCSRTRMSAPEGV